MDPQTSAMTFISAPDGSFTGSSTGPMGTMEITGGTIEGDAVAFTMKQTKPFPMRLKTTATIDGDTMDGAIDTGAFGKMTFNAIRQA